MEVVIQTYLPRPTCFHLINVYGVVGPAAVVVKLDISRHPLHLDRFESSLDVDALAPGNRGIGQAVPGAASPGDVHTLAPQVPERLCDHQDGIMGQCRGVLWEREQQ